MNKGTVLGVLVVLAAGYQYHATKKNDATRRAIASAELGTLSSENFVEIYMPPDCGGCPICKKQVASISDAGIRHEIVVLDSADKQIKFSEQIKRDTNDPALGGPERPFKMPVMKVNGSWVQSPFLKDLKPLLR